MTPATKKPTSVQMIAITFIVILILNLILLAMKKIDYKIFWLIMVIAFGVSYLIKKSGENNG